MSAEIPYVVTIVVQGLREVIVDAVTAQEAIEIAENMQGVIKVLGAEAQE